MATRADVERELAGRHALLRRCIAANHRALRGIQGRAQQMERQYLARVGSPPPRWWREGWQRRARLLREESLGMAAAIASEHAGDGFVVLRRAAERDARRIVEECAP